MPNPAQSQEIHRLAGTTSHADAHARRLAAEHQTTLTHGLADGTFLASDEFNGRCRSATVPGGQLKQTRVRLVMGSRICAALSLASSSFAQVPPLWGALQPGPERVGFTTVFRFDPERTWARTYDAAGVFVPGFERPAGAGQRVVSSPGEQAPVRE